MSNTKTKPKAKPPIKSPSPGYTSAELAAVKARAKIARAALAHKPGYEELIDPADRGDAAPFYFQFQACIQQLKAARTNAGLTLADVSEVSGIALETLSRLETGTAVNPTWQTLGKYAVAVGCHLSITANVASK